MIYCDNCGLANRDGSRFCNECGHRLGEWLNCGSCGFQNPVTARFCNSCGDAMLPRRQHDGPSTRPLPTSVEDEGTQLHVAAGEPDRGILAPALEEEPPLEAEIVEVRDLLGREETEPIRAPNQILTEAVPIEVVAAQAAIEQEESPALTPTLEKAPMGVADAWIETVATPIEQETSPSPIPTLEKTPNVVAVPQIDEAPAPLPADQAAVRAQSPARQLDTSGSTTADAAIKTYSATLTHPGVMPAIALARSGQRALAPLMATDERVSINGEAIALLSQVAASIQAPVVREAKPRRQGHRKVARVLIGILALIVFALSALAGIQAGLLPQPDFLPSGLAIPIPLK